MSFEVRISSQAESDLRGIYEYIARELLNPESAKGQIGRLEESILGLCEMPERFRRYENEPWHSRGMRIMPVDNYCVFYCVTPEIVTVIRVMYGGRDIDAELIKHTRV